MSWEQTIRQRSEDGQPLVGSFRGARFVVPSADLTFGRRVQVHEYPLRDQPWPEDLGRRGREFSVDAFVSGPDYLAARDALIAAVETEGPGTLVHPYYGRLRVSCTEARVRESSREGGWASFSLTFVEWGEATFPSVAPDTQAAVETAAEAAQAATGEDFVETLDTETAPDWSILELEGQIDSIMGGINDRVSGFTSQVSAAVRAPYNCYAAIMGGFNELKNTLSEPFAALNLYAGLFGASGTSAGQRTGTPTTDQLATNTQALEQVVQRTAVIAACQASAEADYTRRVTDDGQTVAGARDDALSVREDLVDALDALMEQTDIVTGEPIADSVYSALASLRAAVSADLTQRGARLPQLRQVTLPAPVPALVLAHRLYGDATRAAEIVTRNRIAHPGFCPAGQDLEVLDD